MRLSTIAKIVAALLLVLVVALIAAAKSLHSERYNAFLAGRVKAASGLDLAFSGATKLKLGLSPRISFTGVTLSAGKGDPLLSIDRVEADIALIPLALRQLRLESLTLIRPTLRPSQLALLAARPGSAKSISLADSPEGAPTTQLSLSEILIENGTLLVGSPAQSVTLTKARLQPESEAGGPLALQVDGKWQDRPFTLGGSVGPASTLLGAKPYPLQVKAGFGGSVITVRGTVASPLAGRGLDLDLKAQGEELAELLRLRPGSSPSHSFGPFKLAARLSDTGGTIALADVDAIIGKRDSLLITARGAIANPLVMTGLDLALTVEADSSSALARLGGIDLPSAGPLKLSGKLNDIDNGWRLTGLKSNLGRSDLSGELSLVQSPRPRLYGRLAAGVLALNDFTLPQSKSGDLGRSQPLRPAIPVADGRILPSDSLPLDMIRGVDADLSLVAARLLLGPLSVSDASAELRQSAGRLTISEFSAQAGDGILKGEMKLDAAGKVPSTSLRVDGNGLSFAALTGAAIQSGTGDLALDLRAQGVSLRAMAGSVEGTASAILGEIVLAKGAGGDLAERLIRDLAPPLPSEDGLRLRCLVARFPVKAGLINADRGLAAETSRTGAIATGTIDLRSEALDIIIAAKGTTPLRVKGQLGAPVVAAEGKAAFESTPCRAAAARR
ncbi:MAG: AsmA family protein, partial [Magnetospirillum sp.]|nr:AsmA family protein [Magnetospirillum sp.]